MPRVIHFEIHATNPATLVPFYEGLFGWTIKKWDGPFEYYTIVTGPDGTPGINGGLVKRMGPVAAEGQAVNAYVCTVDVPDVDEAVAKAVRLGGVVAVPKMAIPGVGWLAYVKDPDVNILGLMHNDPKAA